MKSIVKTIFASAFALTAIVTTSATVASAQYRSQSTFNNPSNVIYVNPVGPIFGLFTGEYERKLNSSLSLGVSGTIWDRKTGADLRYNSADVRLRFYPQERTPDGFAIGVSLGMISFRERPNPCPSSGCERETATNGTFGVQADYNWVMGPSRRFVMGTGLGAKRIIGETGGDTDVVPSFRFNIGYAF